VKGKEQPTVSENREQLAAIKRRAPNTPTSDDDCWLNQKQVAAELGLTCRQSVDRWRKNPKVKFPGPDITVNGRNYWTRRRVRIWKQMRAEAAAKSQVESVK
jgi:hypothetical protein